MKKENEMGAMSTDIQYDQQTKSFPLPWDRFWARCIDLLINLLILFSIFVFLRIGSSLTELINQDSTSASIKVIIIVWLIVSAEFLLYEFLFIGIFGATPGKYLFRIKVIGSDGEKITFSAAWRRAISVYWFGHYFSLLTIDGYVFGYWFSSRYYKKTGIFRWNKASNSVVIQAPLSPLRRKLLILLAVACLVLREFPLLIFLIELSKM